MFQRITLLLALLAACSASAEAEKRQANRLKLDAELNMQADGQAATVKTVMSVDHTWRWSATKGDLNLSVLDARIDIQGQTLYDYKVTPAAITMRKGGKPKDIPLADIKGEQGDAFRSLFGKTVFTIETNESGQQLRRVSHLTPAGKQLFGDDLAINLAFFHPEAPPAKDEWTAERTMSPGQQGTLSGKVTYKLAKTVGTARTFAVSGTMTVPDGTAAEKGTFKDYVVKLAGEQTYDVTSRLWSSGKVDLDISFKLMDGQTEKATVKGLMKLSSEPREDDNAK